VHVAEQFFVHVRAAQARLQVGGEDAVPHLVRQAAEDGKSVPCVSILSQSTWTRPSRAQRLGDGRRRRLGLALDDELSRREEAVGDAGIGRRVLEQ
jgi:hypothetical protein